MEQLGYTAAMTGNSIGTEFRITTAGESHGPGNMVIIDGCPPGISLDVEDLRRDLIRRRPGQSRLTTQRKEDDEPEIMSGVFEGKTTGSPIAILIRNCDQRSRDYSDIKDVFRPGHADFTYWEKYGLRDYRGGGRSSARETVARVAAGAVARKFLHGFGIEVLGWVDQIGAIKACIEDPASVTLVSVESTPVRCPDPIAAQSMIDLIDSVRMNKDSIGGRCSLIATNLPVGLGEPVFDRLKADLAKAIMSIPAVTAFEVGSGVRAAEMKGSEHNDAFIVSSTGKTITATNNHGGMLGGISSGMPILLKATVKPTSSIATEQATVTQDGQPATLVTRGRHDPCLLPRFVPVAEAMVLLCIADHLLRWRAQCPEIFRAAYPNQ